MPIGKPKITAGRVTTTSVVTQHKEEVAKHERTYSLAPRHFKEDDSVGIVAGGHRTIMRINYQGVDTEVTVNLPCVVSAQGVKQAYDEIWEIVEQELQSRQAWAKDVLETFQDIDAKARGR